MQPDAIVCSSLMEALNKGSQPERVLQLLELMKRKEIPLNQKAYFEIIASCSMYVHPVLSCTCTVTRLLFSSNCCSIHPPLLFDFLTACICCCSVIMLGLILHFICSISF